MIYLQIHITWKLEFLNYTKPITFIASNGLATFP